MGIVCSIFGRGVLLPGMPARLVRGHVTAARYVLSRNVQRFRVGLVFKAHRLLYHSTLGLRVIKKKKSVRIRHHLVFKSLLQSVYFENHCRARREHLKRISRLSY